MSTLFRPGLLIFQMHTGRTGFDKELGQLYDGRESPVTSITVGDNGTEIIDGRTWVLAFHQGLTTFHVLTAIVKELGSHELIDLCKQ